MRSNNMVILRGNLGADPEAKVIGGTTRMAVLRVATSHRWKVDGGEQKERTDWHSIDVFGATADFCLTYLKKGDSVNVLGAIRNDVVESPAGKKFVSRVRAWEVQGLGAAGRSDGRGREEAASTARHERDEPAEVAFHEEALPF